ncbi:MAG: ClpP family protease [Lachnospiraceae bacterium]
MANNYSVPALEKESANGIQQVSLITDAFTNRRLFLFGEIDQNLVFSFTMQMLSLMEDEQSEINIYINSPGGEVNAGLAIYDLIQSCKATINMYCIGMAASMGALIFAGGQRGRRFILPHSKVMIHEPLIPNGVGGSASSIKSTADSILQTREMLNGILAEHSGKTLEEINKATDHDNFMTAKEAIEFGLCDEIVTRIV